jgi:hypothetical protein
MCKIVRLLYALVPFKRFRAYLIRSHLAACRDCLPDVRETEGWAELLRPPDWISREAGYWPELERRMQGEPRNNFVLKAATPFRPLAGLAVAAGGVLAVVILAVLFGRRPIPDTDSSMTGRLGPPRVEVLSAEVQGRPGRSSVYQTKSASFIWFYLGPRKEG